MAFPPADALQVTATDRQLISGRGLLKGWSLHNLSVSVSSRIRFHDGGSANGNFLGIVNLAMDESVQDWFGESGVLFQRGIFIESTQTGAEGTLWVVPETRLNEWGIDIASGPGQQ